MMNMCIEMIFRYLVKVTVENVVLEMDYKKFKQEHYEGA
jgi:hypothetical protein